MTSVETKTPAAPKDLRLSAGIVFSALVVIALGALLPPAKVSLSDQLRNAEDELRGIRASNDGFAKGFLAACGSPCRIRNNYGGVIGEFKALAATIIAEDRIVIIEGDCMSACAMMADLARRNVLITNTAKFGFHNSSAETPPPESPDINAWVMAHGGYPSFASCKTTDMTFDEARAFFRPQLDWYREPKRMDAPWHWPGDPIGIREATYGLPTFVIPSPATSMRTAQLRGAVR